jgi:tRNA U34 2-thiouridine synthase MnmA/TrmU
VRLLREQGVPVAGLHFVSVFSPGTDPEGRLAARVVADELGVPLLVRDATRAMLEFVPSPRFGWGRHLNPCLDCRVHHLAVAKSMLAELGASYVATGEVLGQRPMSQLRAALARVEREAGLEGLVLRPLTALNLEPTLPERRGWVERERLLGIKGRGRSEQTALARKWGVTGYTTPAGGCLLADPGYAWRLQDHLNWEDGLTAADAHLLKLGRHFRLADGTHVVVGRNERENAKLLTFRREGDWVLVGAAGSSPETILRGSPAEGNLRAAARLTARYSRHRDLPEVEVVARPALDGEGEKVLLVPPATEEEVASLAVRRPERGSEGSPGRAR